MNRATLLAVCFCLLAGSARGQQIAAKDLAHAAGPAKSPGKQEKYPLPKGCKKLVGGLIADGIVSPPEHGPREIVVGVTKINGGNLWVGSEVEAEVRLRNSGEYPIQIPWSTHPQTMWQGQDPSHTIWDYGHLSFDLQGMGLVTESQPLYGSKYVAGSMLAIQPGEWVTFEVKFQLEPEYPIPGRFINAGEGQLQVAWQETSTTWDVHNCSVGQRFFQYGRYYHQQNPPVTIKIN